MVTILLLATSSIRDMMNPVNILLVIERIENQYICTSRDEVGNVAVGRDTNKSQSIFKCKKKTIAAFEQPVTFGDIEEMY